ncbi:MAG: STAS domain-containing protein [Candidatus Brocadiia bacterium]
MAELDIAARSVDGVPLLALVGRIDVGTAPELRRRLQEHLREEAPRLILDLSGVEYMDTGGLATLIEAQLTVQERQGKLVVIGLSDRIRGVFSIGHVVDMFTVVEGEEQLNGLL